MTKTENGNSSFRFSLQLRKKRELILKWSSISGQTNQIKTKASDRKVIKTKTRFLYTLFLKNQQNKKK